MESTRSLASQRSCRCLICSSRATSIDLFSPATVQTAKPRFDDVLFESLAFLLPWVDKECSKISHELPESLPSFYPHQKVSKEGVQLVIVYGGKDDAMVQTSTPLPACESTLDFHDESFASTFSTTSGRNEFVLASCICQESPR